VEQGAGILQDALTRLQVELEASAVALIDQRNAQGGASTAAPPTNVGKALEGLPCLSLEWLAWYGDLLSAEEKTTVCTCPERHQLHGLVIEKRWVVLLVACGLVAADGSFEVTKALNYFECMSLVRMILEEGLNRKTGLRGQGGGGQNPAELAIPLSWHRKSRE